MKKLLVVVVIAIIMYVVYGYWINPPTDYPSVSQAIIIGNTSNSAAVNELDNELFRESVKYSCMNEDSMHKIIRVDGSPKLVDTYKTKKTNMRRASDSKREQMALIASEDILTLLKQVEATEPEVDIIDALNEGVRAVESDNADVKKLVFVCNMFSTTGVLNFTNFNTNVSTDEVVSKLKNMNALPEMTGIDVEIYGFAAVAPPQKEASFEERAYIKSLYGAIFEAAGANSWTFYEVPASDYTPNDDLPKVTVINFLDYENCFNGSVSFDGGDINFVGDTAKFVNESNVHQALNGVASFLKKDATNKILIVGCTATGDKEYCLNLSKRRASAVKDLLIDIGIASSQIEVLGVGCLDPFRVEDTDSNGHLIEHLAYKNRRVILIDLNSDPVLANAYRQVLD